MVDSKTQFFQQGTNYASSFSTESIQGTLYVHCTAFYSTTPDLTCGDSSSEDLLTKSLGPFKFAAATECEVDGVFSCGENSECIQRESSIACICRNGYSKLNGKDQCVKNDGDEGNSSLLLTGGGKLIQTQKTNFNFQN